MSKQRRLFGALVLTSEDNVKCLRDRNGSSTVFLIEHQGSKRIGERPSNEGFTRGQSESGSTFLFFLPNSPKVEAWVPEFGVLCRLQAQQV